MPTPSPYFESAGQVIDQSKAALLKAVAEGGTAGKQAFDAAQAQAAQAKQEAVARAAQRSSLYGPGGNDQTFLGAYDDRMNQQSVNRTNFESGLAQTQASGESYMEKVRAAMPVHQAININKGVEQETKIKQAIAAAQAKAQEALDKENRSLQRTLDAEARAEARAIGREGRAATRATAKEATNVSADALFGAASQQQAAAKSQVAGLPKIQAGGNMNQQAAALLAGGAKGIPGSTYGAATMPLTDLAAQIGRTVGVSPAKIAELYSPSKQSSLQNATQNLAPAAALDSTAKALATKYAPKGVTYDLARSVLGNVDFKEAVTTLLSLDPATTTFEDQEKWVRDNFITRDGRNWTAEYNVLVGEYLSRFPKA